MYKSFKKTNILNYFSIANVGKLHIAERYVRTLKNKIFEHVSVFSRNVNFDKQLILLTNSCKSIVYSTKKIKPKSIFLIVILYIFIVKTKRNQNLKLITSSPCKNFKI